jgi:hypothetical protein
MDQVRTLSRNNDGSTGAAALRSVAGIVCFAVLGLLLSFLSYPLFARFGLGAVVVVLAVPVLLAVSVRAVPEFVSGLRSLRRSFGWREWSWLLLFVSAATFEVRNVHETLAQPLNGWAVLRLGPEMIVAVILAWRIAGGKSSLRYLFTGLPGRLAVFCLVALVSTTWSIVPIWTFYKSAEFLLDVTVAALIFESARTTEDWLKVLSWTWIIYAMETSIAWIGLVVSPADAWDDMGRLRALYPMVGANNIGTTGALLTLVAISRLLWRDRRGTDRAWYWAVFIFGMATMVLAQTRNAIAGFLVGVPLILIFARRKRIGVALVGLGTPLLMLSPMGTVIWSYLRRGQSDEAIQGFTGRMEWWQYAWEQLSFHPLTGLGAFAGGRFGVLARMGSADAAYLHSDWLEIAVGTSFWGILAFVWVVAGVWWYLCRGSSATRSGSLERDLSVECIGVMGMLTVHSFFNNELCWHPPLLFLAVLGYAEFLRRRMKEQRENVASHSATVRPDLYPSAFGSRA